jgi:hypothetical protein
VDFNKFSNENMKKVFENFSVDKEAHSNLQLRIKEIVLSDDTKKNISMLINPIVEKRLEEKAIGEIDEIITNKVNELDTLTKNKLNAFHAITEENLKTIATVIPVGTIISFGGNTDILGKSNWMVCDGSELDKDEYPELFDVIEYSWGRTDDNLFIIPDLRGRFLRGVDGDARRDPDRENRKASRLGGNTGNMVGSVQNDATRMPYNPFINSVEPPHEHKDPTWNAKDGPYELYNGTRLTGHDYYSQAAPTSKAGEHSHDISGGDLETRPQNAYVYWIIKVR